MKKFIQFIKNKKTDTFIFILAFLLWGWLLFQPSQAIISIHNFFADRGLAQHLPTPVIQKEGEQNGH